MNSQAVDSPRTKYKQIAYYNKNTDPNRTTSNEIATNIHRTKCNTRDTHKKYAKSIEKTSTHYNSIHGTPTVSNYTAEHQHNGTYRELPENPRNTALLLLLYYHYYIPPVDCPWGITPMDCPRAVGRLSVRCLRAVRELSMGCVRAVGGLSVGYSRAVRGLFVHCPHLSMGCPRCPRTAHELSMSCPRPVRWLSVGFPRIVYGLSTACRSTVREGSRAAATCPCTVRGLSTNCLRAVSRLSMSCPRAVHGLSMGCSRAVHGLFAGCP